MPDVTVSLTQAEYDDLETISTDREEENKITAHDLLVGAVAAELAQSQSAQSSGYQRGVQSERLDTSQLWADRP